MIRLTSYHNGSPIYVPADVVIKENYKYEFGSKNALPVTEYKPIDGEVARKVLEWRLVMERYLAYANAATLDEKPQSNECWELAANARAKLVKLAGLEEQG